MKFEFVIMLVNVHSVISTFAYLLPICYLYVTVVMVLIWTGMVTQLQLSQYFCYPHIGRYLTLLTL